MACFWQPPTIKVLIKEYNYCTYYYNFQLDCCYYMNGWQNLGLKQICSHNFQMPLLFFLSVVVTSVVREARSISVHLKLAVGFQ